MGKLGRGNLLPRISETPPGPRSRALSACLASVEAPGVNTLVKGHPSLVWEAARGANVQDVDDNIYIDLTSGFGAALVGHRHPRVVKAVTAQARKLLHGLGDVAPHPARIELATRLAALAPVEDGRVFFAVSGSDAVEIALKTARLATGRSSILCFDGAYHGLSLGALSATARTAFRAPFESWLARPVIRLPFGCPQEDLETVCRGNAAPAVALVEPIQGREGIHIPPPGWLHALLAICNRWGVILAVDEIFTGFGRTGSLFAVDQENVRPHILICGKALAGGLPLAAAVGKRSLMDHWETAGEALHTGTFLAHPLSCAAALETLDLVRSQDLPRRAMRLGAMVRDILLPWQARWSRVREVRGRGLVWGIELTSSRLAKTWSREAMARGVLALAGGARGRTLQIVPPLTITRAQLLHALHLLQGALERVLGEPLVRETAPP